MRTFICYILITIPFALFGQRSNTIFSTGSNDLLDWTYSDFLKSGIKEIRGYSYKIKKNGKVKKRDSTMLFQKLVDLDSNKVFGINCNLNYQSHGPAFYSWYNFNEYYNDQNQLIKYVSWPKKITKEREYGSTTYNVATNITTFEYNQKGDLYKKVYKQEKHYYSISKYTKDTFHLHSINRPKIDEYIYNSKKQKIKWYHTVDSTKYLPTKSYNPESDSNAVRCSYCHSKYLNVEWKYDENDNLIEWVSYTNKGIKHTKRNYLYDNQNRLIKQVDSTGWYFSTIKPYWESTTTYQYTDSIKTETKVNNTEARFGSSTSKIITTYDKNNRVISSCSYFDSQKSCNENSYQIINRYLTQIRTRMSDNHERIEKYIFNDDGLLIEEHHFSENKLIRLIKYYYKK